MRRVPEKRGLGRPRRPTHPRARREGGRERTTFAPTARAGSRVPGDSGVGAGPSPRPSGSTHSASSRQESHSPRPPPCVPPGEGAEGCFRAPPLLLPPPDHRADAQSVPSASAGPPGQPLSPYSCPRPRGRPDWLAL